ncbi:MAG: DUF2911 domain-containing protein, partial [Bacteroidetes bacterium]|nr:DUF2911 domain-containing protein [Bacteroidota bacterium]
MKKLILAAAIAFSMSTLHAQNIKTPAPSPTQTIKQDFGISSIELSYSRPGMKGRKIFGDLVPFGKVWRTGANSATTITFGDDVLIGDRKVPAGKYGLLTIPDKTEWTIIISAQTDVTSPAAYNPEKDIVRTKAKARNIKDAVECFTMQFADVKPGTCELNMEWENTSVALPISTDVDKEVMAQIDDAMNKDNHPYFAAAMYYMETGRDLNVALGWFRKAADQNP